MAAMSDASLSAWLRKLREERSVPLRVVAAAVDMDSTLLSKLEVGDRVPTDAQAEALARYYGVTVEEMRRRLVAARILHEYGGDPALPEALSLVREEAKPAPPPPSRPRKPITYKKTRRNS
ncbi:MAG: helix-turn-helix transcriptional regulator [Verrucomicrobiota bacterium]